MADSKWSAHLDKLAYGVASLLGIVLLVLPFVMGGDISAASEEAKKQTQSLKAKIEDQRNPSMNVPGTADLLADQWTPGQQNPRDPKWIHQIAPVLIRKITSGSKEPAAHMASELTEVTCQRDSAARKATLSIKGNLSAENKDVVVSGVELWRRAGEGVFEKIHTETLDTDVFEYIDEDVTPGEKYSYRLVSIAGLDPEAEKHISAPTRERMPSADLGPTPPVPHDVSARIYSISGQPEHDDLAVMAKVEYWDYETGEMKGDKRPKLRKERERFGDKKQFEFFPIDPLNRRCRLRDHQTRAQYRFKQGDKAVPVALFEPVVPGAGGDDEADDEGDDEAGEEDDGEAVEAEPAEDTPAEAPAPAGGSKPRF